MRSVQKRERHIGERDVQGFLDVEGLVLEREREREREKSKGGRERERWKRLFGGWALSRALKEGKWG